MPSTIPDLPPETFQRLIRFLPIQNLFILRRVCRQWQAVIESDAFIAPFFSCYALGEIPLKPPAKVHPALLENGNISDDDSDLYADFRRRNFVKGSQPDRPWHSYVSVPQHPYDNDTMAQLEYEDFFRPLGPRQWRCGRLTMPNEECWKPQSSGGYVHAHRGSCVNQAEWFHLVRDVEFVEHLHEILGPVMEDDQSGGEFGTCLRPVMLSDARKDSLSLLQSNSANTRLTREHFDRATKNAYSPDLIIEVVPMVHDVRLNSEGRCTPWNHFCLHQVHLKESSSAASRAEPPCFDWSKISDSEHSHPGSIMEPKRANMGDHDWSEEMRSYSERNHYNSNGDASYSTNLGNIEPLAASLPFPLRESLAEHCAPESTESVSHILNLLFTAYMSNRSTLKRRSRALLAVNQLAKYVDNGMQHCSLYGVEAPKNIEWSRGRSGGSCYWNGPFNGVERHLYVLGLSPRSGRLVGVYGWIMTK
ncbi:hypothetical protein BJ742DRAFT_805450 [Cladochytrium replicatum]|nr:hypothetical protein BJ742DRAFT_805450 [Cladochytrium replicatum]